MSEATVKHETVFDVGHQQVGAVYAKALIGATEKAGNSEKVLEELDAVTVDVLDKLARFEGALVSPRVPLEAKESMLQRALGAKLAPQAFNFLRVLCKHGRFDCLRASLATAHRLLDDLRRRVTVQVRTAVPLDAESTRLIAERLGKSLGKTVQVQGTVDPELIGGIVIRIGDTVYDGSVATRLVRLRETTSEKASQLVREALDRFVTSES